MNINRTANIYMLVWNCRVLTGLLIAWWMLLVHIELNNTDAHSLDYSGTMADKWYNAVHDDIENNFRINYAQPTKIENICGVSCFFPIVENLSTIMWWIHLEPNIFFDHIRLILMHLLCGRGEAQGAVAERQIYSQIINLRETFGKQTNRN